MNRYYPHGVKKGDKFMADEKEKKQQPEFPTSYGGSRLDSNNGIKYKIEDILNYIGWGLIVFGVIGSLAAGELAKTTVDVGYLYSVTEERYNFTVMLQMLIASVIPAIGILAISEIIKLLRRGAEAQEKILEALNKQSTEE